MTEQGMMPSVKSGRGGYGAILGLAVGICVMTACALSAVAMAGQDPSLPSEAGAAAARPPVAGGYGMPPWGGAGYGYYPPAPYYAAYPPYYGAPAYPAYPGYGAPYPTAPARGVNGGGYGGNGYPGNGHGGYGYAGNGYGGYGHAGNGYGGYGPAPMMAPGWNGPSWAPPSAFQMAPHQLGGGYFSKELLADLKNKLGVRQEQEAAWNGLGSALLQVKPNESLLESAAVKEAYEKLLAVLDPQQREMAESFKDSLIM